jgi:hypothetical protein
MQDEFLKTNLLKADHLNIDASVFEVEEISANEKQNCNSKVHSVWKRFRNADWNFWNPMILSQLTLLIAEVSVFDMYSRVEAFYSVIAWISRCKSLPLCYFSKLFTFLLSSSSHNLC